MIGLAASVPPAGAQDPGSQVIALVNGLRASHGLPALSPHPSLNVAAQIQANWVIASGNWGHTGEGGSSPQDRATAAGYQASGTPVSDTQPGDMVFFGQRADHVGIYIGDGQMVEAPYTGARVRISSIYRSDLIGATRPSR